MRIVVSEEVRANLDRAARTHGLTHAQLSRAIGRGGSYIGRFIRDGVPALLTDADARTLAAFTGTDPRLFGVIGYKPPKPEPSYRPDPHWYRKPMPGRRASNGGS